MNLEKLFEKQRELDERILDRFPELRNENLLDKKILALQVELGELAQNWRGFKFWSEDQEPNVVKYRCTCGNIYKNNIRCNDCFCNGYGYSLEKINPLLEEYVDCLHFILSIGLELNYGPFVIGKYKGPNVTRQFNFVYQDASKLDIAISEDWTKEEIFDQYDELVRGFNGLGEMLGFTWEQIEQAYFEKNAENHRRQEVGY